MFDIPDNCVERTHDATKAGSFCSQKTLFHKNRKNLPNKKRSIGSNW